MYMHMYIPGTMGKAPPAKFLKHKVSFPLQSTENSILLSGWITRGLEHFVYWLLVLLHKGSLRLPAVVAKPCDDN